MAMKYTEISSNLLQNKAPESSLLHFRDRFHALFSWQPSAWESNIMQIKIQMAATMGKYNMIFLDILGDIGQIMLSQN